MIATILHLIMEKRKNRRDYREYFVRGEHLKLKELKSKARHSYLDTKRKKYLFKNKKYIPPYPRPEFHVSHVKHDTERGSLCWISKDGGFKDPHGGVKDPEEPSLVWWSLAVAPEEIRSAERRLLKKTFPYRTEEQARRQQSFLRKFASSPAFSEKSRYGSYRFTFTVEEVLEAYSEQFCFGAPPVLRVFKTSLYKQEVVYAVLVHSPHDDGRFSEYPELPDDDPNAVCAYRREENIFIWRPEAMCGTHWYELNCRPEDNLMEAWELDNWPEYYVWDHVALALHVESGQVLKFDSDRLRQNLKFCERDDVTIAPKFYFDDSEEAQSVIESLWPESSLEKNFAGLSL
ncbi:uncharacterized protein LOC106633290 [Haplochromis burtoni]|uniref:uncharacterized protein LOC106633290 n=1 Tax=Haplochromis burtoni TaxID=8153 RepID=UPI0006C9D9C3|nr:uncharacterized protein LOC106633290 [Haplochromis burtoni]